MQGKKIKIEEYNHFFDIIKNRFEKHDQVFTIKKQIIFKILYQNTEHLSVDEIVLLANKNFNETLTSSSVYRILGALEILGIVDNIIVDDKKRFELVYFKQPHYHLYCQECHTVSEFESLEIHNLFLEHLNNIDFKPTNFNVIINGVCSKCKK